MTCGIFPYKKVMVAFSSFRCRHRFLLLRSSWLRRRAMPDLDFGFFDSELAAVVAAFATDGVVNVPSAAVGADSQSGGYGFVVGSTLSSAGF